MHVALQATVSANFGAEREQLITAVARLFGFSSTSAQLRSVIEAALAGALASGTLREEGTLIVEGSKDSSSGVTGAPAASMALIG
jgi:hypothetical protein